MNRKTIPPLASGTFGLRTMSIMALVLSAGAALTPATARGQIFVTDFADGTIGEYNLDGTTVNPSLVSGLNEPAAIAVSGSDLFVANYGRGNGTIGEYTTSGAAVNTDLVSGLSYPTGIAVSGSNLFVVSGDTVGEYTTAGATVNASLVPAFYSASGLAVSGSDLFVTYYDYPYSGYPGAIREFTTSGATVNTFPVSGSDVAGIVVSGSDLFVAFDGSGTIGEYTTSGDTVNASLVSGLGYPNGIAVSGSDLFVTSDTVPQTIGEYTTSGANVNASLVSGSVLGFPEGIAVVPEAVVPEPATGSLLLVAGAGILMRRRRPQCHNQ